MDFETFNFRNAIAIVNQRAEWNQLCNVIDSVTFDEIIAKQSAIASRRKEPPKGAQMAMNALFRDKISALHWEHEAKLLDTESSMGDKSLAGWKMDFLAKGVALPQSERPHFGMGIEVAFNHAEAIPWTLIKLNLAAEFDYIAKESRIDVGVAVFAAESFKKWGKIDNAAGTFEQAIRWLSVAKHVIPTPMVLIGLNPRDSSATDDWEETNVFPGTRRS